jgi:hypothetical protein
MTTLFVVCLLILFMPFALLIASVYRVRHDPGGGPRSPPPTRNIPFVNFECPSCFCVGAPHLRILLIAPSAAHKRDINPRNMLLFSSL